MEAEFKIDQEVWVVNSVTFKPTKARVIKIKTEVTRVGMREKLVVHYVLKLTCPPVELEKSANVIGGTKEELIEKIIKLLKA